MSWDKLIGPGTLVYLITVTIGGVWWASDLSTRAAGTEQKIGSIERRLETSSAVDARIVRLEVLMGRLDTQLDRIETKLDRWAER